MVSLMCISSIACLPGRAPAPARDDEGDGILDLDEALVEDTAGLDDDADLDIDDRMDEEEDSADDRAGISAEEVSDADLVGDERAAAPDDDLGREDDSEWSSFDDAPERADDDDHADDDHAFGEVELASPLDADDGGQEGTRENIEGEIDEAALPDLDADADGGEHPLDAEPMFVFPHDTVMQRIETIARQGASSIGVHEGRVAFAGAPPFLLERGASSPVPIPARTSFSAIVLTRDALVVGTARGVELSLASGATTALVETSAAPRALVASHGRTWALVDRTLWPVGLPASPSAFAPREDVLAIAQVEAGVVALRRVDQRITLERFRGDDEGWAVSDVGEHAARIVGGARVGLSATLDGARVAIFSELGLCESSDRGATFRSVDAGAVLAVTFAGRDATANAIALVEADEEILCVRVDEEATLHLVHASARGARPAVAAIAWDETRNVAFVGTFAEVYSVGPRRTH